MEEQDGSEGEPDAHKPSFFSFGVNRSSLISRHIMSLSPPRELKASALHSHLILMNRMVNDAANIPHDWSMTEKSLATLGGVVNARVMIGKATAPPPSFVIPKSNQNVNILFYKTYLISCWWNCIRNRIDSEEVTVRFTSGFYLLPKA